MRKLFITLSALAVVLASCSQKKDYPYKGVSFEKVHFTDGLLAERMDVVRENTIPFAFSKCEETGRIANFARAAGLDTSRFTGLRYDDSDVYKVMEAASYSLATRYDAALDRYLDSLIALVAAAQEPDGYLFTIRTSGGLDVDPKSGQERWEYIEKSHELYNVGHMYEAAVAHWQVTGKTNFLDIAIRNADLIYDTFLAKGRKIVSGHEEIELALVKLYRATGDKRYLELSHYLLECRGESGVNSTYMQNHLKVKDQYEAVGHAVRATYLYMAMTDIAAIYGNKDYRTAIDSLWNDITGRKIYITGGIGSTTKGESFGDPFFLPDAETHCETCAAVGNCMWNYRMFLLTGEGRYFDIFERGLYNNVLHAISDDGMTFFYGNELQCNPDSFNKDRIRTKINPVAGLRTFRKPWFRTSCCPTNLARIILSLPGYVYALGKRSIYVNLFQAGSGEFETLEGEKVEIDCQTAYPIDGDVRMTLKKAPRKATALRIRIPGWAVGNPVPTSLYTYIDKGSAQPLIFINGSEVACECEKGYAVLDRKWKDGDEVEVRFEMPVRIVKADDRVKQVEGRIAVERGPLVYCTVLPEEDSQDIRSIGISADDRFEEHEKTAGIVTLTDTDRNIDFIPYYRHAQDVPTQMSVWVNANR